MVRSASFLGQSSGMGFPGFSGSAAVLGIHSVVILRTLLSGLGRPFMRRLASRSGSAAAFSSSAFRTSHTAAAAEKAGVFRRRVEA